MFLTFASGFCTSANIVIHQSLSISQQQSFASAEEDGLGHYISTKSSQETCAVPRDRTYEPEFRSLT